MQPLRQWGSKITAKGIGGLPGGLANGYELETLVDVLRWTYRVRVVQMPWSGTADKNDLSTFLTKNPSELRSYLVAQNLLGPTEPLLVANTVAATDARKQAGWSFTSQPHYRSALFLGSHRTLAANELQRAKDKGGADASNDEGEPIVVPSTALVGKLFAAPGNMFNALLIAYGVDPASQVGKTSVTVGGIEIVATANPKGSWAADATSFHVDLRGNKPAPNVVRIGVPFRAKRVTLEAGANPGFGIAPSPTCRSGRDCNDDLRKFLDVGVVRRICSGTLDDVAAKYETGLTLAPPVTDLAPGFTCP